MIDWRQFVVLFEELAESRGHRVLACGINGCGSPFDRWKLIRLHLHRHLTCRVDCVGKVKVLWLVEVRMEKDTLPPITKRTPRLSALHSPRGMSRRA